VTRVPGGRGGGLDVDVPVAVGAVGGGTLELLVAGARWWSWWWSAVGWPDGAADHDQPGDEHGRDDPEGTTHAGGIGSTGSEPNPRA
jgi:hypothetical protein